MSLPLAVFWSIPTILFLLIPVFLYRKKVRFRLIISILLILIAAYLGYNVFLILTDQLEF